ncbi:dihydrolipoamide acetyltransferase family protein [Bradyrhizobium sp. dw_78]|uniref:dihydrolipoamide acetyltransferase family protein n=1 Tax=Bradyrhizobium sp. dw_78 TaxID=2719793 RepID=UPI001BD5716D|nr:dihydrolipoamide acetyltransferase family protein [Bradyrhizobium sp. dw_78]
MSMFNLPDLGEGLQDAEIVAWHVAEGDHVVVDAPLVSVETEKAVVEVPSPRSGYIKHLLGKPHERLKVGAPMVEFDDAAHVDTGTVVGQLDAKPETPPPAAPKAATVVAAKPTPPPPSPAANGARAPASPAIRALARERGIDLNRITGSGPEGTITRADIERVSASGGEKPAGAKELVGIRRSMAINMAKAHAEVVPATVWDEADIGSWWTGHDDVTMRLIRAIAAGCAAEPILNSWYDGQAMTLQTMDRIDLGVAVDFEGGLIVPVVRDAGKREPSALRVDVDRLKTAARARSVPLADLRNPTITLSNFGMMAGLQAALVVVPPQVAIVGAGRIFQQAVLHEVASFTFTHVLPLSLTFDHRVATGGEAGRFLKAMIDDLQKSA